MLIICYEAKYCNKCCMRIEYREQRTEYRGQRTEIVVAVQFLILNS